MAWGSAPGQPRFDEDIDANGGGVIGGPEFIVLADYWSKPPGPPGLPCAGTIPCP